MSIGHGKYRPEIDGLRAIAILAVVLFHAEFTNAKEVLFAGGYLGVDIFFVISGYLITKIILEELGETQRFNFKHFYMRRVRRIAPALIVVFVACFPVAYWLLLPEQFTQFSESILASFFFVSNHYFHSTTSAYAADSSLLMPMLHTWSLSVEEQFYVLLPPLAYLAARLNKALAGVALAVLFFTSLAVASYFAFAAPELNFYWLPGRAWELLAGSILASLELRYGRSKNNLLAGLGLIAVVAAFFIFDEETPHPSLYTVVPILGVSLVIYFSSAESFVGRILALSPLVWVGRISYSFYLWHFPVFAFARIQEATLSNQQKWFLVGLSVALSALSYFFVEQPFRKKSAMSNKAVLAATGGGFIAVAAACMLVVSTNGLESRIPAIFRDGDILKAGGRVLVDASGDRCTGRSEDFCQFTTPNATRTVVFVGDSHAGRLINSFYDEYSSQFNVVDLTNAACPFVLDFNLVLVNGEVKEGCASADQAKRYEVINALPNAVVVIAQRWPMYFERSLFDNEEGGVEGHVYRSAMLDADGSRTLAAGVEDTVTSLVQNGHSVVLVYPIPEVGVHVPQNLYANKPNTTNMNKLREYLVEESITTSADVYRRRNASSFAALDSIVGENVYRVRPDELFCDSRVQGRCVTHDDSHIFYADDDHPSSYGSLLINRQIMGEIQKMDSGDSSAALTDEK